MRFTLASRIDTLALDVLGDLVEARYTRRKAEILRRANLRLEKLLVLLRPCHGRRLVPHPAYEHAARELDAVGPWGEGGCGTGRRRHAGGVGSGGARKSQP